jgi:hypothetical protein
MFRSEFIILLCLQLIVFIHFLYSVHNLSPINLDSFCHPTTSARYNCRFIPVYKYLNRDISQKLLSIGGRSLSAWALGSNPWSSSIYRLRVSCRLSSHSKSHHYSERTACVRGVVINYITYHKLEDCLVSAVNWCTWPWIVPSGSFRIHIVILWMGVCTDVSEKHIASIYTPEDGDSAGCP